MFLHSLINSFKILSRRRTLIFWSLLFPIVLGLLFKLALGNVDKVGKFEVIPVSIDESLMEDPFFSKFIEEMEKEKYLEVTVTDSEDLLKNGEVIAHIVEEDKILTSGTGIKETLVESFIGEYLQSKETIVRILSENPTADIKSLFSFEEYLVDKSSPNMSMLNTYFYTLIGMQALYGYSWGLSAIYQYEANLSTEAKRNTIAPINKKISILAAILVAWFINLVTILMNMLIMKYLLDINLGDKTFYILALIALASLTGVSFGTLLGVSNKKDVEFKTGLGIGLTMIMSFLAGMMVSNIKILIQRYAPLVNKLNPVALITDGLYSLYYYPGLDRYCNNMVWLGGITLVFILATLALTRGKKYDSL